MKHQKDINEIINDVRTGFNRDYAEAIDDTFDFLTHELFWRKDAMKDVRNIQTKINELESELSTFGFLKSDQRIELDELKKQLNQKLGL